MPTCPLRLLARDFPTISAFLNGCLESGSCNDGVSSAVVIISCYRDVGQEYIHTGFESASRFLTLAERDLIRNVNDCQHLLQVIFDMS